MSSVLSMAKDIADQKEAERQEAEARKVRVTANYDTELRRIKAAVLKEIDALDGKETRFGKLHVKRVSHDAHDVVAYVTGGDGRKVAWIKAAVVSGTYDASDDCRAIAYTEAIVSARFYPPDPSTIYNSVARSDAAHDGTWDLGEVRHYHNGGWTFSCTAEARLPEFFKEMAAQLAKWL